jgi:hypothetical protein
MLVPSLGGAAVAVAAGIALLLLGEQGPITGRQPQPVRLGSTVLPRPGLSLLQAQAQLAHSSARAERTPSSAAFERQMREYRADMLVALARRYATRGRER